MTESERARLGVWLKEGKEDDATRMLLVRFRHNAKRLNLDLAVLREVSAKLQTQGRWAMRQRKGRPTEANREE